MKKYDKYVQFDSDFKPIQDISIKDKLPPGVYNLNTTPQGEIYFAAVQTNYDKLVHLPNTKYDDVVKEIEMFLSPECKARFKEKGYLYKNSILAHGPHGSGKTCIVNRVTEKVIEQGGIILFCPHPNLLPEAFKALEGTQPGCLLMVIFEELDELLQRYENELLTILDGEIQKDNVIYMATTNHIERIPPRIRRPGRFSAVIQVGYPTAEARRFYLEQKLDMHEDLDQWVERTEGFSIDELKEMVRSVYCLQKSFQETLHRIHENKGLPVGKKDDDGDWEDGFDVCLSDSKQEAKESPLFAVSKPKQGKR